MVEQPHLEQHIPLRKKALIDLLCADPSVQSEERTEFCKFCRLLDATFHYEMHQRLEDLEEAYAPFDPDQADSPPVALLEEQHKERAAALFRRFEELMERANYRRLSKEDLDSAMREASAWGLNMDVDLEVLERFAIYYRGDTVGDRYVRRWWTLWRLVPRTIPIYRRLVLVLKLNSHKRLGDDVDTDNIYIKLFKDIPKKDLEMLIPGATPVMTIWDKGNIGMPALTGFGLLVWKVAFAIFTGAVVVASLSDVPRALEGIFLTGWFLLALAGLISYGVRSYFGYLNARNRYALALTQSLYYQNLDNNGGVLYRLVDEAEKQEFREAALGYFFLWKFAGSEGWPAPRLDDRIEEYLKNKIGLQVDFEIGDALAKLERLNLVEKVGERYRAVPLPEALRRLDETWDNYFTYNNS